MERPGASVAMKIVGWLLIATSAGTLLYWLDFFLAGTVYVVNEDWYLKFQHAFPAADAWMAACALIAGVGLLRCSPWANQFALLAGSAMVFLALLDITFNLANGLYRLAFSSVEMGMEAAINLWTLSFGAIAIVVGLRSEDNPGGKRN
jgi:hypothetical protein